MVLEKVLTIMDEAGFYLPGDILELKNYKDTPLRSHALETKEAQDILAK
jgi:hypothetical protein